jgi:hypothetical protein
MTWQARFSKAHTTSVVVIKQRPHRPSVPQTQIDNDRFIERRRNAGPLFDTMKQLLTLVIGGELQKRPILALAEQIAREKHLKIDRGGKRIKDCFICWFCEYSNDVWPILLSGNEMAKTTSMEVLESNRDPLDAILTPDEGDITWMLESESFHINNQGLRFNVSNTSDLFRHEMAILTSDGRIPVCSC